MRDTDTDFTGSDSCSLRVVGGTLDSILSVTGIYRPPSADTDSFLFDPEGYLFSSSENHVILGDFKIHYLNEKSAIIEIVVVGNNMEPGLQVNLTRGCLSQKHRLKNVPLMWEKL